MVYPLSLGFIAISVDAYAEIYPAPGGRDERRIRSNAGGGESPSRLGNRKAFGKSMKADAIRLANELMCGVDPSPRRTSCIALAGGNSHANFGSGHVAL